jgi:cysteine synthase A
MNMKRTDNILGLIGNTPMVKLNKLTRGLNVTIWAKLESFNPGGSIKDRIALAMIEQAEKDGSLKSGGVILEATSGNTGIGLALVAAVKGYKLILTMPEDMSVEQRRLLTALGAELVLTPREKGMKGAVDKADELARANPGYFIAGQFKNPANPGVHRQRTAQEIWLQTKGKIDVLVAGVGTGGTITGVGEALKAKRPELEVIAVEPAGSAVLSGQKPGRHRIQGIGAGFIPEVLNQAVIDRIIKVDDQEAVMTTQRLIRQEGLIVGVSSGAACFAALKLARELDRDIEEDIVVIFPDTGER